LSIVVHFIFRFLSIKPRHLHTTAQQAAGIVSRSKHTLVLQPEPLSFLLYFHSPPTKQKNLLQVHLKRTA
jgi:hypothetical protein